MRFEFPSGTGFAFPLVDGGNRSNQGVSRYRFPEQVSHLGSDLVEQVKGTGGNRCPEAEGTGGGVYVRNTPVPSLPLRAVREGV